ncbi:MAG: AbrB/MazE/SpoVT family DNA-binding domain-containing protein [Betaproteobacteria bacterium]|nr:AbrB/MazE/SpoVT family DNA-binding domain-containing protein [Betaproteobacteria bacterium]
MTNSVTSKGQVTIPNPVRKALGINTGTRVRIAAAPDPFISMNGSLGAGCR